MEPRKLSELLRGDDSEAQAALDRYFRARPVERIAWYPSAGNDYRDLLELSEAGRPRHGIKAAPNIFVHTEYNAEMARIDPGVIHQDKHTTVTCTNSHRLRLRFDAEVAYEVSRSYAVFPKSAPGSPTIYLLEIEIESNQLGKITGEVLYFLFENYNFLEESILKNRLAVSHFVKVREGCGFGGCAKSISVFYSLLAHVGAEYLLVDNEVHYCPETHDRVARRFGIEHEAYELEPLASAVRWSEFAVRAFKVTPARRRMTQPDLRQALGRIGEGWGRR